VTILVLANDMDVDGDPLAIDGVAQPAGGSVAIDGTRIVYTPSGGFSGTDTFDYTVSDGNGGTDTATVTIAVARINRSPVAVDDEATTQEDEPTTIAVLLNDSDPDNDPLTVQSVGRPEHGTAAPSGASIVYTPGPNYAGPDRFSYTISDGNGGTATADVAVEVLARNDPPRAQNDSQSTSEESAVTIFVLANDSDPDEDNLVIQSVEQPNHGTVSNEGDHLVYRPESGFSGVDDFSYTVADGNGGADTAHVTVVIGTVNDAPVAQDDTVATDEDTLIEIPVLANDSDPDGDFLIVETFSEPDHGTVLNTRTGLSYIPDDGFQGTDSFTYTVSDGNGGVDVAEVTVAVAGVNDAPTALDDTSNTDEGMPVEIPVLLNDTDPEGDRLVIQSVTSPEHGVAAIAEDAVEYTPTGEFNGVDQFSYAVSDGQGGTATATVFVAVAGINDAPIAQDDSGTTAQGQSISIPVLGNDDDPDGDSLTISGASGGVGGSLRIDGGTIIYTPSDGFSGTDVFTYSVADGLGGSDTATVTVGVTAGGQGGAINAAACEGRVIISEVAWAGTTSDARDEWIELRNLGTTPVDLSGWLLQWRPTHARAAEDQIWKRVELSGTIAGAATASCDELDGGTTPPLEITEEADGAYRVTGHPSLIKSNYYVLERRHEDTIADSRANLIYGTTPDMDYQLSDSGDIVMLVDPSGEVVSTANAPNLGRSGWVAGSATTLGTMERIDPLGPDISSNWQTNLGIVAGGHDANGRLLRATPGAENSPSLESLPTYAGLEATTVRQGEMPSLRFDLSRQQRRTTGWPWISVSRPGFAGEGGSIDLSRYSFAGQHEGDQGYILDIGTDTLSPGLYNFLVIHGEGEAVLLPILITP